MKDHLNSSSQCEGLTLVLGGTGKTGRRVVERLASRGVPTRVASRAGDPPFDWDDQSTWDAALDGVAAAYISYAPDLAIPGATDSIRAFVETEKNYRRIVGFDQLWMLKAHLDDREPVAEMKMAG